MSGASRLTIEPGKRGGRPTIRSLRITVYDVLRLLAEGASEAMSGSAPSRSGT